MGRVRARAARLRGHMRFQPHKLIVQHEHRFAGAGHRCSVPTQHRWSVPTQRSTHEREYVRPRVDSNGGGKELDVAAAEQRAGRHLWGALFQPLTADQRWIGSQEWVWSQGVGSQRPKGSLPRASSAGLCLEQGAHACTCPLNPPQQQATCSAAGQPKQHSPLVLKHTALRLLVLRVHRRRMYGEV